MLDEEHSGQSRHFVIMVALAPKVKMHEEKLFLTIFLMRGSFRPESSLKSIERQSI